MNPEPKHDALLEAVFAADEQRDPAFDALLGAVRRQRTVRRARSVAAACVALAGLVFLTGRIPFAGVSGRPHVADVRTKPAAAVTVHTAAFAGVVSTASRVVPIVSTLDSAPPTRLIGDDELRALLQRGHAGLVTLGSQQVLIRRPAVN